jgi:hypothetical protein
MKEYVDMYGMYTVVLSNDINNKRAGWYTVCGMDCEAIEDLTMFEHRDEDFIKSRIWYINMSEGANWIWNIIGDYYNTIDELYHKMYLVDEIASLLLTHDLKSAINRLIINQTMIEIIDISYYQ